MELGVTSARENPKGTGKIATEVAPLEATFTSLRAHHPGARRASFAVLHFRRQDGKDCRGTHGIRMMEIRGKVLKLKNVYSIPSFYRRGNRSSERKLLHPRSNCQLPRVRTLAFGSPGLFPLHCGECETPGARESEGFFRVPSRSKTPEVLCNPKVGGWTE